jgi:hypothetical protein
MPPALRSRRLSVVAEVERAVAPGPDEPSRLHLADVPADGVVQPRLGYLAGVAVEVTRLAAVAAALLLVVGCAGGSHNGPSDAAIRHHYFLVGKRMCAQTLRGMLSQPEPKALRGIQFQLASAGVTIVRYPRHLPREYRGAMLAGCQAGSG